MYKLFVRNMSHVTVYLSVTNEYLTIFLKSDVCSPQMLHSSCPPSS